MSSNLGSLGAGAEFEDSGVFLQDEDYNAFADSLLEFTTGDEGYNHLADVQQVIKGEGDEGDIFFNEAFEPALEHQNGFDGLLASLSPSSASVSSIHSEAPSKDSASTLSNSLDDVGFITLNNKHNRPPVTLTTSNYTPLPAVLAAQPEAPPGLTSIYSPLTTLHFRTSADAKAHRRRARLVPKSQAADIVRVKSFGRDYWVRRIYNAMIDTRYITDGPQSIHRVRFTQTLDGHPCFNALDLEATAHNIFDEAIAVHERGWNRPTVYHKKVVRGKLVDLSETSLEMRLSRVCLCLQQKKSSVDDAIRGGVTLALLCDNPEARSFMKASNDVGNKKRGERLKVTSMEEKARKARQEVNVNQEVQNVQEIDTGRKSSCR